MSSVAIECGVFISSPVVYVCTDSVSRSLCSPSVSVFGCCQPTNLSRCGVSLSRRAVAGYSRGAAGRILGRYVPSRLSNGSIALVSALAILQFVFSSLPDLLTPPPVSSYLSFPFSHTIPSFRFRFTSVSFLVHRFHSLFHLVSVLTVPVPQTLFLLSPCDLGCPRTFSTIGIYKCQEGIYIT